jgi:DNA mismatch repair ATPase MutS
MSAYIQTNTINVDNQFILREGYTNVAHYGIRLAEVAGIPASVVNHARTIATKIDAKVCTLPRMVKFPAINHYFF